MFPFEINYKKELSSKLKKLSDEAIIDGFIYYMKLDSVDRIKKINKNKLLLENDFFSIKPGLNRNRWIGIQSGMIEIIQSKGKRNVIYKINTTRKIVSGIITGLLFGTLIFVETKDVILPISIILFIHLVGWPFALIRHKLNFNRILHRIANRK